MATLLKRLGVLLLIATASACAAQTGVRGTVRDGEGAVLSNCYVLFHWDSSGASNGLKTNVGLKSDVAVKTDPNGRFEADLPPGFYDVLITHNSFSPIAYKVRVKAGFVVRDTHLKISREVMSETADDFGYLRK